MVLRPTTLFLTAAVVSISNTYTNLSCDAFQFHQAPRSPQKVAAAKTVSRLFTTTGGGRPNDDSSEGKGESTGKGRAIISPEKIDEVLKRVDIVEAISSYNLPKFERLSQGSSARALCPFHDDNNPSLNIDRKRGIYKCFSCGAGGNILNFMREYAKVNDGKEMSFLKSVQMANEKFTNGAPVDLGINKFSGGNGISPEKLREREEARNSVIQINQAAADFYFSCLSTHKSAGVARSHLRSRGLLPRTIKNFQIGFAPDAYFYKKSKSNSWGKGSLVFHLRDLGFSAQQIVDAGLATVTKRAIMKNSVKKESDLFETKGRQKGDQAVDNQSSTNATKNGEDEEKDVLDHYSIIDRFRGRVMIPIFDDMGDHVIGFGGRIIDAFIPEGGDAKIKCPKYLNSPESLIFQKKKILFGSHMTKESSLSENGGRTTEIIIVEGYMDAIALWQAGIRNVVASMGTALSKEQLSSAGSIAKDIGGRVVICLDNDAAGEAAVDRVCNNNMLSEAASSFGVEFRIAKLPDGMKDPAEFMEAHAKASPSEDAAQAFRNGIVNEAALWSEWHLERILTKYDSEAVSGSPGSFSGVFDGAADFLSTIENPAERTKQACKVAITLSTIIATEEGTGKPSEAARVQLESDIIAKAARIADKKRATRTRIESVTKGSDVDVQEQLEMMSRGEAASNPTELKDVPVSALTPTSKVIQRPRPKIIEPQRPGPRQTTATPNFGQRSRPKIIEPQRPEPRRTFRNRRKDEEAPEITPHFRGFRFANPNDRDWLNITKSKKDLSNHFGGGYDVDQQRNIGQKEAVYFNSNEYHGHRFTSQGAVDAGYKKTIPTEIPPDFSEKGPGVLLRTASSHMAVVAEDSLLRLLVLYRSARSAMGTLQSVKSASGPTSDIVWSSKEREWLFAALTHDHDSIPNHINGPDDQFRLREYLSKRDDVPEGAFGITADEIQDNYHIDDEEEEEEDDFFDPRDFADLDESLLRDECASPMSNDIDLGFKDGMKSVKNGIVEPKFSGSERQSFIANPLLAEITERENGEKMNGNLSKNGKKNGFYSNGSRIDQLSPVEIINDPVDPKLANCDADAVAIDSAMASIGSLDQFFDPEPDFYTTDFSEITSPDERAEIAVQDLYSSLEYLHAQSELERLTMRLESTQLLLRQKEDEQNHDDRLLAQSDESDPGLSSQITAADGHLLKTHKLRDEIKKLTVGVIESNESVLRLKDSAERTKKNLLSRTGHADGDFQKQGAALAKTMDKHLEEVMSLSADDEDSEADTEDFLENLREQYGDLCNDDWTWSPEQVNEDLDMDLLADDEDEDEEYDNGETLEETLQRIDDDWGWLEEEGEEEDQENHNDGGIFGNLASFQHEPMLAQHDENIAAEESYF